MKTDIDVVSQLGVIVQEGEVKLNLSPPPSHRQCNGGTEAVFKSGLVLLDKLLQVMVGHVVPGGAEHREQYLVITYI